MTAVAFYLSKHFKKPGLRPWPLREPTKEGSEAVRRIVRRVWPPRALILDWYARHGCTHAHCPDECEHPQPFVCEGCGDLLCGRCYFKFNERSVMIPCTPEVCE